MQRGEAVENQPWSGEANVHVSIANWVKAEDAALLPKARKLWFKVEPSAAAKKLRKRGAERINSALSDQTDVSEAKFLTCNAEPPCVYNGQFPRHNGFVLESSEAAALISKDPANREVVHPFMIGAEMLTHGTPQRWVIDFQKLGLLDAKRYDAPFAHVQQTVLPHVESLVAKEREKSGKATGQDQQWLKTWWQHFRGRKELIAAVGRMPRYLACCEVTKRPIFCFLDPDIRPDHTLEAFVFADDYCFGILQSSLHWLWFITKCSKLKSDFRYTPEFVFDTFPWPQFSSTGRSRGDETLTSSEKEKSETPHVVSYSEIKKIDAVAAAARELRRVRAEALPKLKGGLRALYRTLELPGANPLKDAHAALDIAVLAAYGFSAKRDLLAQLLALNQEVAAKIEKGDEVVAPGVPKNYPDAKRLVTEDCIRPLAS